MPARPAVLAIVALVALSGCTGSPQPEVTATVTETATASPSSSTPTPEPSTSSAPEPSLTMTMTDEVFLRSARLLEPQLEAVDDETVRGFGRKGCEAVTEASARGLDARTGFEAYVSALRINVARDPSQREAGQTLIDIARAGVPQFCPQYLDEATALEVTL